MHAFSHSSIGLEILEAVPDPDVVVVCCGGGGLVAGIATSLKLSGSNCRIYAVEPTGGTVIKFSLLQLLTQQSLIFFTFSDIVIYSLILSFIS